jgi:hypothetical protein
LAQDEKPKRTGCETRSGGRMGQKEMAMMGTSFAQKIEIACRYVAAAVVIIAFCGLSALLGIIAAIAFSPQTPFTLPPFGLLFVSGVAGIVIVFALESVRKHQ